MLTSSVLLRIALIHRYSKKQKKANNYNKIPISYYIILFILELALLLYAMNIALKCGTTNLERLINILLALFFTIPYIILNLGFNKCITVRKAS